jgi:tRNA dimethylallyltransferase
METATRRYAKRQLTWFRRETWLQSICLPAGATAECALDLILPHVPCPPNPPPPSTST